MTIAATIGFILVCFMLFAIAVRLWFLLWNVMVVPENAHDYDGRWYWDEEDRMEVESLEEMGTKLTPIEFLDPEERYES